MRRLRYLVTVGMLMGAVAVACASCGTTKPMQEPVIVAREVAVPVPVSCIPKSFAPPPVYPDTDEALRQADDEKTVKLLTAGRDLRIARLLQVEPAIEGCRQ